MKVAVILTFAFTTILTLTTGFCVDDPKPEWTYENKIGTLKSCSNIQNTSDPVKRANKCDRWIGLDGRTAKQACRDTCGTCPPTTDSSPSNSPSPTTTPSPTLRL